MELLKDRHPVIRLFLKSFRATSREKTPKPKEIRWKPKELAQELERLVQEGKRIREKNKKKAKLR